MSLTSILLNIPNAIFANCIQSKKQEGNRSYATFPTSDADMNTIGCIQEGCDLN